MIINDWRRGAALVLAFVVAGQIPGAAAFLINSNVIGDIGLAEMPVSWPVLVVLWVAIYAGMGATTWRLVNDVPAERVVVPIVVLVVAGLQTTLFWGTDSLRGTAVTDATGVLLAGLTAWVVGRESPRAVWFLAPWLVWMPTTLAIKLALIL